MLFKNITDGKMVEEDIYFTSEDKKQYYQITRLDSSFVLAIEAKPGNLTPAPGIICLRKSKG